LILIGYLIISLNYQLTWIINFITSIFSLIIQITLFFIYFNQTLFFSKFIFLSCVIIN